MIAGIDFETVCYDRASVVSVGIAFRWEGKVVTHSWLVKPPEKTKFLDRFFVDIHGITENMVQDAPSFPEVWNEVKNILGEDVLWVAHNAAMELSCLEALFTRYRIKDPVPEIQCTYRLSKSLFPQLANHKLDTVAEACNVPLPHHHDAGCDASACFQVFEILQKAEDCDKVWQKIEQEYQEKYGIRPDRNTTSKEFACQILQNLRNRLAPPDERFAGRLFVLSGNFAPLSKEDIGEFIDIYGGAVRSAVSKQTSYLVLGDNFYNQYKQGNPPSCKCKKALVYQEDCNIQIISWNQLFDMMK